jgi:hypothetical protein
MHRSGTSALSGVACALGASAPNNPLPANFANPSGYWESWPLVQVHDELLASADSSWDDWKALDPRWYVSDAARRLRGRLQETIRSEYEDKSLFVMKDPRVCRFLPFFLSVLEDMSIAPVALFPIRNPLEVAFSLRRRDGFSISKSAALWLRHVLDAEFHSRQIPRCFISYENLLKGWRQEMDRASDATGVKWPVDPGSAAGSIDKFLTAELYHERTESVGLERNPDLSFLAAETFHLLGGASKAGAAPDLFGRLDALRERFGEASNFFGSILRNEEKSVQKLRSTLNQKLSALERQRQSVEEEKSHQQALMLEESKNFRQASIEQQEKYQLALMVEQTKYQRALAEEQEKLQQALKAMEEKHQQALEDQRENQMALTVEREKQHQALAEQQNKHEQALKEVQDKHLQALEEQNKYRLALTVEREKQHQALAEQQNKHEQALKEVQDKHLQALEEQNKYRLALIAAQEKYQQASTEERSRHEQALADARNRHQQELHQKESERNDYVARLSALRVQHAELNSRIEENDTRLNLMIKELTNAFDSKRGEHAKALADLQSSKKVLDEMRGALAASRDVGERQANKLKEIEARHSKLLTDAQRKQTAIDDLSREIDVHKRLLADRDQQIQALMAQIKALYASKSWRITRPFRVAMRFFSKP